ncbi:TetR family transcriptional regulator [Agrobacterium vitis]|uniref:TetR family transcriptional regulator n=2 Tax=Agrobacterium vitis TaxID=373 RepID=A0ABD6G9D4_AGRVI|nr:TetR family transcriptional regulator [Agrobacterium vitis]MUO94295.1 TetR family transcriptional regulator [Agrobacterium vitis]MUP03251.1 TetR family transcriptional regulator [Agrobacterium vitis]MUZ85355.1 TetR family transcriptional regulator [Agrobacterium vitis]MVA10410.1 TetR family transcriptional regulator [Agrobacterium vitis]
MRKLPRQLRSKATVDAIIEAAARILSEEGWAGFTTNKVAEVAGVSVGSYYQYFPDKHSLIDAIRNRHLEDCRTVLKNVVESNQPQSDFVKDLVDGVIGIHSVHPRLHRVLLDEAPSSEIFRDPNSNFEKEYLGYYCAAVAKYCSPQNTKRNETMGIILSDAIDGVIHNAARRGTLQTIEVRNELVRMVQLYLSEV